MHIVYTSDSTPASMLESTCTACRNVYGQSGKLRLHVWPNFNATTSDTWNVIAVELEELEPDTIQTYGIQTP